MHEMYVKFLQQFKRRRNTYNFHPDVRPIWLEPCVLSGTAAWRKAWGEVLSFWISTDGCALYIHPPSHSVRLVTSQALDKEHRDVYCVCSRCSDVQQDQRSFILVTTLDFLDNWPIFDYHSRRCFEDKKERKQKRKEKKVRAKNIAPNNNAGPEIPQAGDEYVGQEMEELEQRKQPLLCHLFIYCFFLLVRLTS